MPNDRSTILTEALRINPAEVRWHFFSNFYDGPISGLAFFRERLYRFCCFPEDISEQRVYVLHELTPEELTEELRLKEKFEKFVGTHWSFDQEGKRMPRVLHPEESWKRYYDEEKSSHNVDPRDRPIIAWFGLSSSASANG